MSSVATFHLVKMGELREIASAARSGRAGEAILRLGEMPTRHYDWSGYVMVNVLDSLDELGVELESPRLAEESAAINADFDYTTLITDDAKVYLDRLDPGGYEPGDLLDGPIELGLDGDEARAAMVETLASLGSIIAGLADDDVLLLHIG
ncbi:hypothetical protein M1L60_27200 [Actinoplanes sp. TRM 88003]|uniref:Uncharacterized protein n=1 Tax=Paractinoplanes aksuensis TaxID=2939490 RepID=A0ABT1DTV9_9ACTN|nr:hypothetical protein [Actinoplanes aksuensis]MCO8274293.1 hypothetical protein [Actinoplanes aksuensis]